MFYDRMFIGILLKQLPKPVAKSKNYIVSNSHPYVTQIMVNVFQDSGNAVYASIAYSPSLGPFMS